MRDVQKAERLPDLWVDEGKDRTDLEEDNRRLRDRLAILQQRVKKGEERRQALVHLLSDLKTTNQQLAEQRTAVVHLLEEREKDRSLLADKTKRLDNSRRALLHILQDVHISKARLEQTRKAMIHIMGNLRETTEEIQRREHELREKQQQLVQAGKLATLGELTTGVAHELNNPLNNIGLFLGNVIDHIEMNQFDQSQIVRDLRNAMQQVRKATEIISHLRTFGRAAPVTRTSVPVNHVIKQALSLIQEQFRLHQIETQLDLSPADPVVHGNAIQLEQVFINLLTNARDAVIGSSVKSIFIQSLVKDGTVVLTFQDSGPGIAPGLEQRIFDPFFTTKEVGAGTGLGLSITYGILKEHRGTIALSPWRSGEGARFVIRLPLESQGETDSPGVRATEKT
jgi:C4-dicarboxylate-specific signal transduction histidine kinase